MEDPKVDRTFPTPEEVAEMLREIEPEPRTPTIAHVGISVPDIDVAVEWYTKVLGFRLLSAPMDLRTDIEGLGDIFREVYDPALVRFKVAQLTGANGSGIELLEFVEPVYEPVEDWNYARAGTNHVNVVNGDVEGLLERIQRAGGRIRTSRVWPLALDTDYRFGYAEDPWGAVIEVYSHPPERVFGGPPQQES